MAGSPINRTATRTLDRRLELHRRVQIWTASPARRSERERQTGGGDHGEERERERERESGGGDRSLVWEGERLIGDGWILI